MFLIISALSSVLAYIYVIAPLRRFHALKARRDFNQAFDNFKLRMVKRYYREQLKGLSYAEIEESFNVNDAYHRLTLQKDAWDTLPKDFL